jgi:hypothetical protein
VGFEGVSVEGFQSRVLAVVRQVERNLSFVDLL